MKVAEQTHCFRMTAFLDVIARLMDAVTNQVRNRWVCFYRDGFVFARCGFVRAGLPQPRAANWREIRHEMGCEQANLPCEPLVLRRLRGRNPDVDGARRVVHCAAEFGASQKCRYTGTGGI